MQEGKKKWVLVIDDEDAIRDVFKMRLEDSGYQVLLAEDGEKGVEIFKRETPKVVITDLKMPGIDGIEVLHQIMDYAPATEVILCTGHGEMDTVIAALRSDASDFLPKPVDNQALINAVEKAFEKLLLKEGLDKAHQQLAHREFMQPLTELKKSEKRKLPFLTHYGYIVDHLFSDENRSQFAQQLDQVSSNQPDNIKFDKTLLDYGPQQEQQEFIKLAQELNTELSKESFDATTSLQSFRIRLSNSNERDLVDNPFYKLTKQLFVYRVKAAQNYFKFLHAQLFSLSAQKVKKVSLLMNLLGLATFIVSMFTTAYGVNYLLQSFDHSLLRPLAGEEGQTARLIFALILGFSLSYVILALKTSLFRGILDAGQVLAGIRKPLVATPFIVILGIFLTCVSIKTNYDGGIAFFSKTADLAEQSVLINSNVKNAFNKEVQDKSAASFYQLIGLLQSQSQSILAQFKKVPEDEASGDASSGDARQGPRYWGKYYVVNGGFDPQRGKLADLYRDSRLTREVDLILTTKDFDFSTSIADKIAKPIAQYQKSLAAMEAKVQDDLASLDKLMKMNSPSVEEVFRIAMIEYYDINRIVRGIVATFVQSEKEYQKTVAKLNALVEKHIEVLTRIDRSGGAQAKNYQIKAVFPKVDLSSIMALKNGLPRAQHKSFEQLISFLNSKYGEALAKIIMGIILAFSLLFDLADLFFFAPFIARQGRREAEEAKEKIQTLKKWEQTFFNECQNFFDAEETHQVFQQLTPTDNILLVYTFYKLSEDIDTKLLDKEEQSLAARIFFGFMTPFQDLHTEVIREFNCRANAIMTLLKDRDRYVDQYFNTIFPTLMKMIDDPKFSLQEVFKSVKTHQDKMAATLLEEIEQASLEGDTGAFYQLYRQKKRQNKLLKRMKTVEGKITALEKKVAQESGGANAKFLNYTEVSLKNFKGEREILAADLAVLASHIPKLQKRVGDMLSGGSGHVTGFDFFVKFVTSFFSRKRKISEISTRKMWLVKTHSV